MILPLLAWIIVGVSVLGVIVRPFGLPEYVWATAGAVLVVLIGTVPLAAAAAAAGRGADVYEFLVGMMLLSEFGREQGLFDYLAHHAVRWSKGSRTRLFAIVYAVGTVVTIFMSNDATAVVLTPAVAAAARAAKVPALPYLFVCAFIANAASFVLPISNPANLVVFADQMPPLPVWLMRFALPSVLAIVATFVSLRLAQAKELSGTIEPVGEVEPLTPGGRLTAVGIAGTALVLLVASSLGWQLGLPTLIASAIVAALILVTSRQSPWPVLSHISWGVLPLVAGLFVLVEALAQTGVLAALGAALQASTANSVTEAAAWAGVLTAFGSNIFNNLPVGLIAAAVNHAVHSPTPVTSALLVGVDLGPNLSVAGSLATILWLIALRREGVSVSGLRFLMLGVVTMIPALVLALAVLLLL